MEHYFSENPKSAEKKEVIRYRCKGHDFIFRTSSSVFSKSKVDIASDILINKARIAKNSRILDIGCGYGAIGIAIAFLNPGCKIVLSDLNERAVRLAKENIGINGVKADIFQGNLFEHVPGMFDIILSNPPIHAGRDICFDIINKSYFHLENNGTFQMVARHSKGGKELSNHISRIFGNVETLARKSGFHVYIGTKI